MINDDFDNKRSYDDDDTDVNKVCTCWIIDVWILICISIVCIVVQMESSLAEKQHAAAVEAYTRQCMKSHAGATMPDDVARGRVAGVSRGPTQRCRSNEQLAMSELTNSRELRPNNLVYCIQYYDHSIHTHTHLTAPCPRLPRWAGTRKVKPVWISLKQETLSGSGTSWAVCKCAPCSREIIMPAPHHSVFHTPDAFLPPN